MLTHFDALQRLTDEWVPVQGGSGAIHIQVSFKPAQVGLVKSCLAKLISAGPIDDR